MGDRLVLHGTCGEVLESAQVLVTESRAAASGGLGSSQLLLFFDGFMEYN